MVQIDAERGKPVVTGRDIKEEIILISYIRTPVKGIDAIMEIIDAVWFNDDIIGIIIPRNDKWPRGPVGRIGDGADTIDIGYIILGVATRIGVEREGRTEFFMHTDHKTAVQFMIVDLILGKV